VRPWFANTDIHFVMILATPNFCQVAALDGQASAANPTVAASASGFKRRVLPIQIPVEVNAIWFLNTSCSTL